MIARGKLAQAYYDSATLLDAGVPILRSLDIMIQGRQGYSKRVFSQIRESLSQGSSLAESMDRHRNIFPEMDRMVIEAAETAGSLGDSLKTLSQWHEFIHRITWRMIANMGYPLFILHAAFFIVSFPALFLGQIGIGGYFGNIFRGLLPFYVPVALVVASILLRDRIPWLRLALDWLVLRIPILNRAVYHLSICRYTKAFGMLYKAGVPITECTERATRATGNRIVARLFKGGNASVRQGGMASAGFSPRLPAEYRDLWRIGEETGELDKTVDKVAEIAADRADLFFKEFARWLPIVIYFVILIVTVIMILKMARQIPSFSGNWDF